MCTSQEGMYIYKLTCKLPEWSNIQRFKEPWPKSIKSTRCEYKKRVEYHHKVKCTPPHTHKVENRVIKADKTHTLCDLLSMTIEFQFQWKMLKFFLIHFYWGMIDIQKSVVAWYVAIQAKEAGDLLCVVIVEINGKVDWFMRYCL